MNLLFWGMTMSVVGKILLATGVVMVHRKMTHVHKIDRAVERSVRLEMVFTLAGVGLILFGYLLEIMFFGGFSNFLTCQGDECAAALGAILSS